MSYLSDLLGDVYKEGMTEEEISNALESIGDNSAKETTNLKNLLSKANSEAAKYKKELRAKQTDEEAKEAERKAEIDKILNENAELKRNAALADRKGKLLAMGYDTELADSTAIAMVDGDMDTVLANQTKFNEIQTKKILADQMRNTPRPASGNNESDVDYSAKIEEANSRGDFATAAYYNRLMAMSEIK